MQKAEWGVPTKERVEYIPLTRSSDKMNDEQKESVRLWNLMVKTLRDNGLMEEK